MSSAIEWIGGASAVAQIAQKNVASSTNGQTFIITLAYEDGTTAAVLTHTVDGVDAGNTTTIASEIQTEFNALTHELATVITASNSTSKVILTADSAGVPFYVTYSGTGTWDDSGCTNTANSGPSDWNTAANWSTGVAPVNGDGILIGARGASSPILYGLYHTGVTLSVLELPFGGPAIGTLRFPLVMNASRIIAGRNYAGTGALTAPAIQNLYLGTVAFDCEVAGTGTAGTGGYSPLLITGSNASNSLSVSGNSFVGVNILPFLTGGQLATITNSGTGRITTGASVATCVNSGTGDIQIVGNGAVSGTLYVKAGSVYVYSDVGLATVEMDLTGVLYYNGRASPDIDNLNFNGGGVVDLTQDARDVTFTAIEALKGAGTIRLAKDGQLSFTTQQVDRGASLAIV